MLTSGHVERFVNPSGTMMAAVAMIDLGNAKLGAFELLRRIAVGGMGEVFLARQRGLAGFDRLVVIKRLLPDLAEVPGLVTLFVDEARIAAHLTHPNIVQVYEFGHQDGAYYLSMEYVAGQNLAKIRNRQGAEGVAADLSLSRDEAVYVVAEMARALASAHRACDASGKALGIVHRDVSPHNVLVSYGGDVKLMDFGIAKAANASHRTEAGVIRGKLSYMSPEQARGDDIDVRSDVFSAGIVLWELTLGRDLFAGSGVAETLDKVCSQPIPRPRSVDPTYPLALEAVVMSALERDLATRMSTASELGNALRDYLASAGVYIDRERLGGKVRGLFPEHLAMLSAEELVAGTSSIAVTRELDATRSLPMSDIRTLSDDVALPSRSTAQTPAHGMAEATAHILPSADDLVLIPIIDSSPGVDFFALPDRAEAASPESAPFEAQRSRGAVRIALVMAALALIVIVAWTAASRRGSRSDTTLAEASMSADKRVGDARANPPPDPDLGPETAAAVVPSVSPVPPADAGTVALVPEPAPSPRGRAQERVRASAQPAGRPTSAKPATNETVAPPASNAPASSAPPPEPPKQQTPAPVDAAAARPVIARGTLIVDAEPEWGEVTIIGRDRAEGALSGPALIDAGSTPVSRKLPVGTYQIRLRLSAGGGQYTAEARVTAGERTKCKLERGTMACTRPGQ